MNEPSKDAVRSDQPDGVLEDEKGNVVVGAPTAVARVHPIGPDKLRMAQEVLRLMEKDVD